MENPRKTRAFGIVGQANAIRQVEAHTYKVRSQSGNGHYVVTNGHGKFECTCPDFLYRVQEGRADACKHVIAVRFYDRIRQEQDQADTLEVVKELERSCKKCGSTRLIKRGKKGTKPGVKAQYECKACGHWFLENGVHLARARIDERLQGMAVDLYYSGFSVRKIKRFLQDYYRVRVSHVSIYKWLRKYGRLVSDYTKQFKPTLSGVWNADEMMVKLAHEENTPNQGRWFWCWNIMDRENRFLLANKVTRGRSFLQAREAFHEARQVAKEAPSIVITDALASYAGAYAENLTELQKIAHMSRSSIRSGRNNRIERFHGSVREREKVMRSLKYQESGQELLDGYRVWYNFVRPHMALGGLTPAQASEVPLELGPNKTLALIRKATKANA